MFHLQPFDPYGVLLVALLNPVVIAVAFFMGRDADQWQKVIVAAFAATCAGFLFLYALAYVRFVIVTGFGAPTGVFVAQFFLGLVWAFIGYRFRPDTRLRTVGKKDH
ncbi:MAG: hypothetical protein KJ587_00615 [Alphaproteobacteria bacterium]|nr:hypothetical protein [Alphaproteobacteria bacterium]